MKNYLKSVLVIVLGALFTSCVPSDPAAIFGPNWNSTGGNNPNGIVGPRILHKIDSANITKFEYISTNAGILTEVKDDEGNKQFIEYGANNKISKTTHKDAANNKLLEFSNVTYNNANQITYASYNTYNNFNLNSSNLHSTHECTVTYNSNNQISYVFKRMGFHLPSTVFEYTHYSKIYIDYVGNNVSQVKEDNGLIIGGVLDPATQSIIYKVNSFDNKINPYTTLPKEYLFLIGLQATPSFLSLSYNNGTNTSITAAGVPAISFPATGLTYDPQNYLIGQDTNMKYIYKPIQ